MVSIFPANGPRPANVTFHGEVRAPELLARFYREADFLVVPSFAEGMPTVILEAFAQGLPVIASDDSAVAGAVVEGRTGFLVRPGDVAGLIAAMRKAVALSDADYRAMSSACLAAIASEFSPDSVRTAFLGIVDEAFEPSGARFRKDDDPRRSPLRSLRYSHALSARRAAPYRGAMARRLQDRLLRGGGARTRLVVRIPASISKCCAGCSIARSIRSTPYRSNGTPACGRR